MVSNVFYFNPTCEMAVANGSFSYMPPRLLHEFEQDCSVLPFVFGTSDDFVLTDKKPSADFISRLIEAGFDLPEFCSQKELLSGLTTELNAILPWGWSPAAHFILKDLKTKCAAEFRESPVCNWTEEHKKLYERATSLHFLTDFLTQNPLDFFVGKELIGRKITIIEEIEDLLKKHNQLVLKAPLSSSGRGIQIIRKPTLNTSNRQWISGVLNQQKYLIVEPFLNKMVDFSFQFKINNSGEPEYLGYSVFENNSNGQYRGTLIHPETGGLGFAGILQVTTEMIGQTAILLKNALKNSVYATWHSGFLGIDAMIYYDKEGVKIQPCIEINSRMNMGILTMFIEKKIDQHTTGKYELFYGSKGNYQLFAAEKSQKFPMKMRNGKLYSGFLPLVEPDDKKQFGAYIIL